MRRESWVSACVTPFVLVRETPVDAGVRRRCRDHARGGLHPREGGMRNRQRHRMATLVPAQTKNCRRISGVPGRGGPTGSGDRVERLTEVCDRSVAAREHEADLAARELAA